MSPIIRLDNSTHIVDLHQTLGSIKSVAVFVDSLIIFSIISYRYNIFLNNKTVICAYNLRGLITYRYQGTKFSIN